jgi:hypothetical protein
VVSEDGEIESLPASLSRDHDLVSTAAPRLLRKNVISTTFFVVAETAAIEVFLIKVDMMKWFSTPSLHSKATLRDLVERLREGIYC